MPKKTNLSSELFEDMDCVYDPEDNNNNYQEYYDVNIKIKVQSCDTDTALDIMTDEIDMFLNKLKKKFNKSKEIQVVDYEIDAEVSELET
jgi:ribosome-associated translation inhibitor RaiA